MWRSVAGRQEARDVSTCPMTNVRTTQISKVKESQRCKPPSHSADFRSTRLVLRLSSCWLPRLLQELEK